MGNKKELLSAILANVFSSHNPFYYRSSTFTPFVLLVRKRPKQQVKADEGKLLSPSWRQLSPCHFALIYKAPRRDKTCAPGSRCGRLFHAGTRGDGRHLGTGRSVRWERERPTSQPPAPLFPLQPLPAGTICPPQPSEAPRDEVPTQETAPAPTATGAALPPPQRAPCACALSSPSSWVIPPCPSEGRGALEKCKFILLYITFR